jgi:hypothetical protein
VAGGLDLMRLVQIDAVRGDEALARSHAAECHALVARTGAA